MGIDIYTKWKGQTEDEHQAQFTGFDTEAGKVGYLREAYHGSPYITKYLVKEAYEAGDGVAKIPASTLKERLPVAVLMSFYRDKKVYSENPHPEMLDGIEGLQKALTKVFSLEIKDDSHESFARECTPIQIGYANAIIEKGLLPPTQQSFVDFVELCERKEKETGEPCEIHFS